MDKDFSSVGIQYIICECGDNFPNENLLNIHLANDHGDVETFQCDVCPAVFAMQSLLQKHKLTHKVETQKKPEVNLQKHQAVHVTDSPKTSELKTYSRKTPLIEMKRENVEKQPPVIKLRELKRIDSISLIQNLKNYGQFIKIEPPVETPNPPPVIQEPTQTEPMTIVEEMQVEEPQMIVKPEAEVEADEDEEIYYQCDVCNSIFYTEQEFEVHYRATHAIKLETPTAEDILEEHLVSDHGAQSDTAYYYECEMCHKIFANEKYFTIHYNKAHSGLLTIVESPQEELQSQPLEELVEEPPAEPEPCDKPKTPERVIYYKCDLCKTLYPSEKAYNHHFDKKHGSQSCQDIQTTGFQFIEQDLTQEYRPQTPEELFFCEFCPKQFTMKRSLQMHRKRAHLDEVRSLEHRPREASRSKVCDVCGRAYNSNAALRYHQRRHTGEKPYACTLCPKRFTMPMFLQIHTRTHTGEKPYECPHCPKAFTNKAALIRHDRVHTGVKPYPCPECGKFFTQSNSMKLHVSTVHLKLPAPYKSKNRRNKSEARALQLALKNLPGSEEDQLILST